MNGKRELNEIWRPVVGFEGLYEVSNLGRVRSLDRIVSQWNRRAWIERKYLGQILCPRARNKLYAAYILYDKDRRRTVGGHVLVAEAFIGPRPIGLEVCHNNGMHADNRLVNLRYDTPKSNSQDTIKHGRQTRPQGEKHGMSKFTQLDIHAMRQFVAAGLTQTAVADLFDTHQGTVSQIIRRIRWAHV